MFTLYVYLIVDCEEGVGINISLARSVRAEALQELRTFDERFAAVDSVNISSRKSLIRSCDDYANLDANAQRAAAEAVEQCG